MYIYVYIYRERESTQSTVLEIHTLKGFRQISVCSQDLNSVLCSMCELGPWQFLLCLISLLDNVRFSQADTSQDFLSSVLLNDRHSPEAECFKTLEMTLCGRSE